MPRKSLKEAPTPANPDTAQGRYDHLAAIRYPYLMRGRECAVLTIPTLLPPEGATGATKFYTPFQSVGAEGVKNLASKLLLTLFPPGSTFFRLTMDDFVVEALEAKAPQGQAEDARAQFEEALAKVERAVVNRMGQKNVRTALFEGLKQLIVAGNVLFYVGEKGDTRYYRLDKYVVKRDVEGNVTDVVVKDSLSRATLPADVQAILAEHEDTETKNRSGDNTVDVYTRTTLVDGKWTTFQEVCGQRVPNSDGTYALDKNPWIPARLSRVDGEDYGRGHAEEFLGDLQSLEKLTQSIVEFAAAASKILFFVSEGGSTQKKRIARAPSGSVLDGNSKDVTILQLEKMADFRVAKETADMLTKRLERAFLLLAGSQRDAERVTAEEIRLIAQELETALGGVYSLLAMEVQRPLAVLVMDRMTKEKRLPALPKEAVSPQIITGLEALGRGSDLSKLDQLVEGVDQLFGQQATAEYVNVGDYIKRRATALGIPIEGLVRSDDEVQQARAAQAQQQLNEKTMPAAIRAQNDNQRRALRSQEGTQPGLASS